MLQGGLKIDRFTPPDNPAGPAWVFGKNSDSIADWKFQQIQDAYDRGKEQRKAVEREQITSGQYTDEQILAWYNSKVDQSDPYEVRTKLERVEVPIEWDGRIDYDFVSAHQKKLGFGGEVFAVYFRADNGKPELCYPTLNRYALQNIKQEFMQ